MNDLLKNMGIKKAFDERNAELDGLGNSEYNLYNQFIKFASNIFF
mgnify:CR=1 FL=1